MSEYHDTTVQRTETIRDQSDAEAAERAETSIHVFSEKHIHVEDDGSGTDTRRINWCSELTFVSSRRTYVCVELR